VKSLLERCSGKHVGVSDSNHRVINQRLYFSTLCFWEKKSTKTENRAYTELEPYIRMFVRCYYYRSIQDHVHGTTNTDIRRSMRPRLSIWTTLRTLSCPRMTKLYYLHEKFLLDGRVAVQSVMATLKASKATPPTTIPSRPSSNWTLPS
jgi:hypothetical protein